LEAILFFGAGWLVAYFFFRRQKRAGETLLHKLTYDARTFLLKDAREKLGLTDVIDLFREKIIDEHLDLLDEPFPYKRCPRCGSKKIKRLVIAPNGALLSGEISPEPPLAGEDYKITCRACGYHDEVTREA
jgi:predicted nucleic-acid-binding Zn-ribbon protein